MKNHNRLKKLKIILILVFITSFFLVSLIYMFLRDVPVLLSLFEKYFTSRNSFFFPFIPNINILWFIPEKYQIFPLSIGQLIDILIIINIISYIDSSFYHYVKNICLNNESLTFTFLDLYTFGNNGELRTQSQDPNIIAGLEDRSKFDNSLLNIKIRKKWNLKKRIDSFCHYCGKKKGCISIIKHKKFNLTFYNLYIFLRDFYYNSAFKIFSIFRLKNRYFPLNINVSTTIDELFQREETEMKKICISFDFEMILPFKSLNN